MPRPLSGDVECAVPEKPVSPARPWGQWATIGWTFLCVLVTGTGDPAATIIMDALGITRDPAPAPTDFAMNGNVLALATLIGTIATVGLVVFLVRSRRCSVRDYLALSWPPLRSVLLCVAGMAVLAAATDATSYFSGRPLVPPVIVDIYRTAWLPGLVFAFVVLAPVGEETVFRGFLYKGIAASKAGPVGAIVLSAGTWAILHLQYDWFGIASIAVAGLYLGFVRYRTGSLYLAMLLHAVLNMIGTIELVAQESWKK